MVQVWKDQRSVRKVSMIHEATNETQGGKK
jgi:hypothetical protein